MNIEDSQCKQERLRGRTARATETADEREVWWFNTERHIGSVGVKVAGLNFASTLARCFPFLQKARPVSRQYIK